MQLHCIGNAGRCEKRRPANGTDVPSVKTIIMTAATVLAFLAAPIAEAATGYRSGNRMIVRNDRGGNVAHRAQEISQLRQRGTRVEIRGEYCMSACTMYLGLRDTCVSPNTVFGFHGPSSPNYGIALMPAEFEHWSQVMASHYPAGLRSWFLREGRNTITGFHKMRGRDLIRMGIARCA